MFKAVIHSCMQVTCEMNMGLRYPLMRLDSMCWVWTTQRSSSGQACMSSQPDYLYGSVYTAYAQYTVSIDTSQCQHGKAFVCRTLLCVSMS